MIAGVKFGAKQQDGGDATDNLSEVRSFVRMQGAPEQVELAIAEPFLQDLIAAKGVIPDPLRNRRPEGVLIEVNVHTVLAEQRQRVLNRGRLHGR